MSEILSKVPLLMVLAALVLLPFNAGAEESTAVGKAAITFDMEVKYVDGRSEIVTDVWETYQRGTVRELCYISGKERPHIHYSEISAIGFRECNNERRMTEISVTLRDDTVKKGLLWDTDSFFGTNKDGAEWRGRIVSLRRVTFLRTGSKNDDDGDS